MSNRHIAVIATLLIVCLSACTAPPSANTGGQAIRLPESSPANTQSPTDAPRKKALPAGTILRVRLYHAIATHRTRGGDTFIASLSAPVIVGQTTVLPKGTVVRGTVRNASSSGRLKGRASITLTLDRMEWNGAEVPIDTNRITVTSSDHKKRNLAWIGGSSAAGALIGGLLGGGKGALIGAGAGGGAGFATAAATGKRQVRLPAESVLTFRLAQPVAI